MYAGVEQNLARVYGGARAADVDEAAGSFDAFFAHEHKRVLAVCIALVGRGAGEDVAQEAFIRTFVRWDRVRTLERPQAWVRRVAINLATSRARRIAAETRAFMRSPRIGAETAVVDAESRFWEEVRRLPRRQAQAVALHYADDLAVADVAAVMGCAEGTVKAHLHAARSTLAARLVADRER